MTTIVGSVSYIQELRSHKLQYLVALFPKKNNNKLK